MKKGLFYLLALAATAMSFSSCEQNEVNAPENLSKDGFRYEFVINDEGAIDESTKATLSTTGVAWEAGDRVGMFLEGYTGYANINMDNSPRTVILYSTDVIPANSYAYAYYPFNDGNADKTTAKIVLPHIQNGAGQSAMPLAGVPFKVEAEAEAKSGPNGVINFMNLGSIIDFKVYSSDYDDEIVDYITFTATNSGAVVAGDGYLDLTAVDQNDDTTLELTFGLGDDYNNVKVNNVNTAVASTKGDASSVFMVLNPGTYSGTITIGTDKATYTFGFTDKTLVRNQLKHYNMNLNNATRVAGVVETVKTLPYSEPFTSNIGEFETDGVQVASTDVWTWGGASYGMKASARVNSQNYDATSWLMSPWIDLTGVSAAAVTFDHVHQYAGTASTELTFWAKTDETNAEWQQLVIPTYAAGNNWTFVNSGEIILANGLAGHKVKVAFKYISSTTKSATWEIKNFSVVEKVLTTEFSMTSDEITVEVGKSKNNNVTVNSGATVTYSSDDTDIATVDSDGNVTGVAEGDTYINVHVDANAGYPAKDDLFEVHVIPASSYKSFTWDLSIDETVSASESALNWNYRGVTMVAAKGSSTTNANNYYPGTSGQHYTSTRFYKNSSLTIAPYSGCTIGYVEFTATTHSYATALKNSSWSNATTSMEDGDAVTLVTVTPDNGSNAFSATIGGTCGFTAVTVYYTGDLESVVSNPVTFTQPATGGSFTVSVGGSPIASGDEVESGKTVTLAATTGTGYEFTSWTVEGATVADASAETTTFVMGSSTVSISATFTQLVTNTVTFSQSAGGTFTVSVDDANITSGASVLQGKTVTLAATPNSGYAFKSWTVNGASVSGNTATATFVMGTNPVTIAATFEESEGTTDILNREFTGVTNGSSNYSSWSNKSGSASAAVYSGNSAGSNDAIQLRSNNNNSGIVSTTSGGYVKKVKVTWESHTANNRTLNVYGNNTAYSAASDLFGANSGDLIGTIVMGTSTELSIPYDYQFVGLRSADGAMYLSEIQIVWSDTPSGNNPPAPTYAVTWTAPTGAAATAGCSIAATVGGNSINSGDEFEEGTVVTITATAGTGYTFGGWTVTGANAADASSATTSFTVGTQAVSFSASFTSTNNPTPQTVTYSVTSTSAVSISGTAPTGSTASYSSTYSTKEQLTADNSMTLTLSGYAGKKITGLVLSMKSNSSKGAGYMYIKSGSTTFGSIGASNSGVNFNNASWNGAWSTSYVNVTIPITPTTVGTDETIEIKIGATVNSLYCNSFTITYE